MTDYNVTTATFSSTLASAVAGDRLICADGTYSPGTVNKSVSASNPITLLAENAQGAIITDVNINGAQGLIFDGWALNRGGGWPKIHNSNGITIIRCSTGSFFQQQNSYDILYKYSSFTGRLGLEGTSPANHDTEINCCYFGPNVLGDYIALQGAVYNVDIINCTFDDIQSALVDGGPDYVHADQIQFDPVGGTATTTTIRGNLFFEDRTTNSGGNWPIMLNITASAALVEQNMFVGMPGGQAILGRIPGGTVQDNTFLAHPTSQGGGGGIPRILSSSSGLTVQRNVYMGLTNESTGVTVANNYTLNNTVSDPANYEDNFDMTYEGRRYTDYVPVSGSVVETGYGALTRIAAIAAGTQDYWDPVSGLQLAGAASTAKPLIMSGGTLTINGSALVLS